MDNKLSGTIDKWIELTNNDHALWNSLPCTYRLFGASMKPTARSSMDELVMVRINPEEAKIFDIVTLHLNNDRVPYVTHRLIKKKKGLIKTLGDGNTKYDKAVSEDRIVAKVIEIHRNNRIIRTGTWGFRIYSVVWFFFKPIRRPLIWLCDTVGKIRRKIFL